MMRWDDLRVVLAVGRHGTLSAAARHLTVNQTTAARRLAALERDLGAVLFTRAEGRHLLTPTGQAVFAQAERVEREAAVLEQAFKDQTTGLSGRVRLTSVEGFLTKYLVPRLTGFRALHPDIVVELTGDSGSLSLTHRETDIALRLSAPRGGTVQGQKLATMGFAVYGAKPLVEAGQFGPLAEYPWVTYDESFAHLPQSEWLAKTLKGAQPVALTNRDGPLDAMVREGLGLGLLACYAGDRAPELLRLSGPEPVLDREIWLLSHPETGSEPRVRALIDWLGHQLRADAAVLSGRQ